MHPRNRGCGSTAPSAPGSTYIARRGHLPGRSYSQTNLHRAIKRDLADRLTPFSRPDQRYPGACAGKCTTSSETAARLALDHEPRRHSALVPLRRRLSQLRHHVPLPRHSASPKQPTTTTANPLPQTNSAPPPSELHTPSAAPIPSRLGQRNLQGLMPFTCPVDTQPLQHPRHRARGSENVATGLVRVERGLREGR